MSTKVVFLRCGHPVNRREMQRAGDERWCPMCRRWEFTEDES